MNLFTINNQSFSLYFCSHIDELENNLAANQYPVFTKIPESSIQSTCGVLISSIDDVKKAHAFFQSNQLSRPHLNFLYIVGDVCRQTDILHYASETRYFLFIEKGPFLSPDDIKRIVDKLTHKNFALIECGSSFGYADRVLDPRSLLAMQEISPVFGVSLSDLYAPIGETYHHRGYWMADEKFINAFRFAVSGFQPKFYVYKNNYHNFSEISVSDGGVETQSQWDKSITDTVKLSRDRLTIIAGPCMLETLDLGLEVGTFLKNLCMELGFNYIFKSSFDKANRTSATGIRGPGLSQGLTWLKQIKETLNVPILTDVHNPDQIVRAAEVADILQIPAFLFRNKDLLLACINSGKTIQIKKAQWASAEDMLNVARFLEKHNCHNFTLVERGSCFGYNNLTVDFRNLVDLAKFGHAVIYDATHSVQLPGAKKGKSSGLRHMVPSLTYAANAIGVDGIFMEVHTNPEHALSDADTQLSFAMAEDLLRGLQKKVSQTHLA